MKPSSSVETSFHDPNKLELGRFTITGKHRPPSLWQKGYQGNHVTAYNLVERGLIRVLNNFSMEETHCSRFQHRSLVRTRREQLYSYISAIAVLDLERLENLFRYLDTVLSVYNDDRTKKVKIKLEKLDHFHYELNLKKLQDVFKKISAMILTFYNQVQSTSFYPFHLEDRYEQEVNEQNKKKEEHISSVISQFEKELPNFIDWRKRIIINSEINSPIVSVKCKFIVQAMVELIDYPELGKEALEKHITNFKANERLGSTEKKKLTTQKSLPRDNEISTLIEVLARHIHIFYSVYFELENLESDIPLPVCKNHVIQIFIKDFLTSQWRFSFNDLDNETQQNQIQYITGCVIKKLCSYHELIQHNNYKNHLYERELNSSDDEEASEDFVLPTSSAEQQEELVTFTYDYLKKMSREGKLNTELKDERIILNLDVEEFERVKSSYHKCPIQ